MVYLPERIWDLKGHGTGYYLLFHDIVGDSYGLRIFSPPSRPPQVRKFESIEEKLKKIRSFNRSGCTEIFAEDFRVIWHNNGNIGVQRPTVLQKEGKER